MKTLPVRIWLLILIVAVIAVPALTTLGLVLLRDRLPPVGEARLTAAIDQSLRAEIVEVGRLPHLRRVDGERVGRRLPHRPRQLRAIAHPCSPRPCSTSLHPPHHRREPLPRLRRHGLSSKAGPR